MISSNFKLYSVGSKMLYFKACLKEKMIGVIIHSVNMLLYLNQ